MQQNMPVTDVEIELDPGDNLVSVTDLKGNIRKVNEALVRVSGFSEAALLGSPHNILRHPDMPAAIFEDLWKALNAGRPWTGILRNRRRNGDTYWVEAKITPMHEDGEITGFMAACGKADPEQIAAARALHRHLNAGGAMPGRTLFQRLFYLWDTASLSIKFLSTALLPTLAFFSIHEYGTDYLGGKNAAMGAAFLVLAIAVVIGYAEGIRLGRIVDRAAENLHAMAGGRLNVKFEYSGESEIAHVLRALRTVQIRLGVDIAENQRISNEAQKAKTALDTVSTSVMIADNDRNIIYLNRSMQRMLQQLEPELRQELPGFDAGNLMGVCVDRFHRDPERQRVLLRDLRANHRGQIKVGCRTFVLSVIPVINDAGLRLGSVLEWNDRTGEVAAERGISELVDAAVHGDFSRRIDLEGQSDFFARLAEGMNRLMDTCQSGLDEVGRVLHAVARGDLTASITHHYAGTFGRLKDDTNTTVESLRELIFEVISSVDAISGAAAGIAAGNRELAGRTDTQASSLVETGSSMEQLAATVKQTAQSARDAKDLATRASATAVQGGRSVHGVVEHMSAIRDASDKIKDIIGVIDGIAFQTNILALNAEIEAAHAGELGRGFEVLAGEVRQLAQRSADAAKQIKQLIAHSAETVEAGTRQVREAGQTMEDIVGSIQHLTDLMSTIAAATLQQSRGIDQVNDAVGRMDQLTQQNVKLVEKAAGSSATLEEQAAELTRSIGVFRL